MSAISKLALRFSHKARKRRAETFRNWFDVDKGTKILDIGSEDGSNIFSVLDGADYDPINVFIADINCDDVAHGAERYGFSPVTIDETGSLPFETDAFDIIYCSSVIEHVTVPHNEIGSTETTGSFERRLLNTSITLPMRSAVSARGISFRLQRPAFLSRATPGCRSPVIFRDACYCPP